jgi:alkylation response protein AidB-like acyl-CoA dehydrogenase
MTTHISIALTPEQQQLSQAVEQFAGRHAPIDVTRAGLDDLAAGRLPSWWSALVDNGFHAVHLPEAVGGQGGGLEDMACVLEAAGSTLLPGPLLTTAVAGAALASLQGSDAEPLLKEIAAGATAVVVSSEQSGIAGRRDGDGWRLTGSTGLTLGMCSAQRVVVPFADEGGALRWAALSPAEGQVDSRRGTDLTTDLGLLHLHDHAVPATAVLTGLDTGLVTGLTVAFTASVAAGITQWCVDAVTEHLRTREQFGKPIGTFQALQHKAAMLLVNSALATAAAWDAVRALGGSTDTDQHRLTVCSAAVRAVMPVPGLVLEALTMLGAIGFTWEHDLHLYWRRAISLAASIGPVSRWTRDLGELSATATRDVTVNLGESDADFRARVGEILDHALTLSDNGFGRQGDYPEFATGARRELLADAGLIAPHWPAPWGCDATVRQQLIVDEEFGKRSGLVRPSVGIAEWILPSVMAAGSPELQERFVPATLRGELSWCQLFSEPGAGSDLASLSTRAVRVEGGWQINGHKIWTSLAHRADFGALLARTDPDAPKHRGIGYFILDMRSPGVEFRQITQSSGRAEFNEVFLTDVFIPDDMVLGEPASGWQLAISTMAHERVAISGYVNIDRMGALRELVANPNLLRTCEASSDSDPVLHAIGEIDAYTNALKALGVRETLRLLDGQAPGPASSIAKVATNVMLRRAAELTLGLTGPLALEQDSQPAVVAPYLDLPAELIGGGTTEIQLNIIAQMILGLPRK